MWWIALLSRIPLSWLYALAWTLAEIGFRVFRYRRDVIDRSLSVAYPELDAPARAAICRRHHHGFAQVFVEILKSGALTPADIARFVRFTNLELLQERLAKGRPVMVVAAHQCNWEWLMHALASQAGYPVDAAYKPLKNRWANEEMLTLRTRFGAHLVPAKELLPDIIKRRRIVRVISVVADQEPRSSEKRHWTRFLNRDTAFYMGAEEIARTTGYAALFVAMRRLARGHYEVTFTPLVEHGERLEPGEFTERYARLTEAQIHAAPTDWLWSHKRWKLKKPLYGAG
ncbi:MAG: Lipid A biosynthesis lauroyltransferase [Steroidobacteraceae bacterium]|nr:Lipid A biosynthesis lauroyltransferase [Steroidobacteraceae bacterium]